MRGFIACVDYPHRSPSRRCKVVTQFEPDIVDGIFPPQKPNRIEAKTRVEEQLEMPVSRSCWPSTSCLLQRVGTPSYLYKR